MSSPTLTSWLSAQSWLTTAWLGVSRDSSSWDPFFHSSVSASATVAGSTPVTPRFLLSLRSLPVSNRIGETPATPSTLRRSSTTPFGSGEKPSWWVTMPAARTCLSMPSSIVARRPAAKIATNTTSATPIISAEAVTAVRCGWRRAFSVARWPVSPGSGRPTSALSGRTRVGASSAKPNIISTAPNPSRDAVVLALPGSPNSAYSRIARPTSSTAAAVKIRRLRSRPTPGVPASRIASTGSMRVARRAGTKPDTTVVITPTSRPAMIVRVCSWMLVVPSSRPNAPNSARSAGAISRPSAMPTIDAPRPITNDSASTEPST